MANRLERLQREKILGPLWEAEKATLLAVSEEIATRARKKAPVRKLYDEGGKRRKGPRASDDTIAAAIRFVQNNKRLTTLQRTQALYLLQKRPQEARTLTHRRGSMNKGRPVLLGKYKTVDVKFKSGLRKGEIQYSERVFKSRGQMARLKQRTKTQPGVRAQVGFEPTASLDKNLNAYGRYELRSGRAFTNEAGQPTTPAEQPEQLNFGGRLKSSISSGAPGRGKGETKTVVQVTASAPYALYVEFPTRHNRAQPFLLPAMKEGVKSLKQRFKYELRSRGLKKG